MKAENQDIQAFMDLGLTYQQAKTFLTLAKLGEAPIRTIAKLSNVARQNIYQTMVSLQAAGLVEKVLGSPVKFRALPLNRAAQILFRQKTEKYRKLETATEELLRRPEEEYAVTEGNGDFVLIPEREAHWRRVGHAIVNSQKCIHTIMAYGTESALSKLELPPELISAIAKGVKVQTLSNQPIKETSKHRIPSYSKKGSFEVRYPSAPLPVTFCSVDEKEAFIATEQKLNPLETSALWTKNPGLIAILEHYFSENWRKAKPIPAAMALPI